MTQLRVLHVDDEADIREVVEISLGLDPDFAVRSCASGEEALVVARNWGSDIILLDGMMPVLDGPATLMRLRQDPRTAGIPVVFITARAQSSELELFRSLGAVGVIAKPFDPMKLAASVRAFVKGPEARLAAMKNEFMLRIDAECAALAVHRSVLQDGGTTVCSMAAVRRIAHGLAGAGGVFGYDELSLAAAGLEEAVVCHEGGSGGVADVRLAIDHVLASARTNATAVGALPMLS